MRTASAFTERDVTRTAHKVAEKIAKKAGVDFQDWIEEAVAEYAEDLGVSPDELSERERLEAIEDRIDRQARAAARGAPNRSRRESAVEAPDFEEPRRQRNERVRHPEPEPARYAEPEPPYERPSYRSSGDPLERAIQEIERRAERNEERTSRALDSLSKVIETRGGERSRLEQTVEEIEKRAQRNEERTAVAIEALQKLVSSRGSERARLEQAVAEVEARAQRNAERTSKALEKLSRMVAERDDERSRLESAIERANKRTEESEARAAQAFESLAKLVSDQPVSEIAQTARREPETPAEGARLASSTPFVDPPSRPAGVAPATSSADDSEEESVRRVSERLARRRRERAGAPAEALSSGDAVDLSIVLSGLRRDLRHLSDKVDQLSSNTVSAPALTAFRAQTQDVERALTAAAGKVADAERTQTKVAALLERVERLAAAQPASVELAQALNALADAHAKIDPEGPAKALRSVERQLKDLGERVEAATHRPPHEARAIEELARRIETLRTAVERQASTRPEAGEIAAVLSAFNDKLDHAAAAGTKSAANLIALSDMVARLEDELRRLGKMSIDARPLDDLAQRIEGMRDEIEKQGRVSAKADDIHEALADLARKIERQVSSANETAWLEESLADIRSRIDSPAFAKRIDAVDATLSEVAARVEATAMRPANVVFDTRPIEDLARRIEIVRGEVEKQGRLAPKADDLRAALNEIARRIERPGAPKDLARIEESLAEIRARLERPAPSPQIEAVDATLRRLAAKLEEATARPQTVALDTKPIEELARRIESAREGFERTPMLLPQVERLEESIGKVVEKLDRAAAIDPGGINASLAEMNRRLEEAFRHSPEFDRQSMEAIAAQVEAMRETVERRADQFDGRRIEAALHEVVEKLERPTVGAADFAALAEAFQTLAARIERGVGVDNTRLETALEELSSRLDRSDSGAQPLMKPLADAVGALSEKIDRLRPDDFAALSETMAAVARKMDHAGDGGFRDAHLENLVQDIVDRLTGIENRIDIPPGASAGWSPVEAAIRELNERIADIRAAIDSRTVEQDVRALHDRFDDLADARHSPAIASHTAQAVMRELETRLPESGREVIGHLLDIQERLDRLAALRPAPAGLELAINDFAEQMEALRATNEAARRDGTTVSDLRAEQAAFDRRLDARFSGVQDVLEKLVDRMARLEHEIAAESRTSAASPSAPASPPGLTMPEIPDRDPALRPPTPEPARVSPLPRPRDETPAGKAAAINAHIAAARRAASAAMDAEVRTNGGDARRAVEGIAQRAQALLSTNSRPVLLGAAGALTLLTGVAVYELRGHAPIRKSEIDAPTTQTTPLAEVSPGVDEAPTGALNTAPPVIAAPIPAPSPSAGPSSKPSQALLGAIPGGFDVALSHAAANGDVGAEIEIAQRFLEGRSVARDPKAAAEWLQTAADGGSAFASYRLGALYEKGVGVPRDAAKARALYTKAAEAGNARAMHNLAVLYAQDGGQGKPDYAAALDWFRRAGALGVRDSQFNLGVLYGRGLGAKQDLAQSWMWFSLAARQGDSDAAHKRDEVAIRMDGRSMAEAKRALDEFKPQTLDPAVNDPPRPPAAAADAAKPSEGKPSDAKPSEAKPGASAPSDGKPAETKPGAQI